MNSLLNFGKQVLYAGLAIIGSFIALGVGVVIITYGLSALL